MVSRGYSLRYKLIVLITPGYIVHDSLDIVSNDFKGSTGLIIHHIVVRISYYLSYFVVVVVGWSN